MNSGHSSRLPYDTDTYDDRLSESVGPGRYRLNTDPAHSDTGCLHTLGPRGTDGVSTLYDRAVAPSQRLVGIESILTNRNMKRSNSKRGSLNPIDVTQMPLKHNRICNNTLNIEHTKFTHPAVNYRGAPVNRFFNLLNDPQANIFFNFEANTTLEARDNWIPDVPLPQRKDKYPVPVDGSQKTCHTYCPSGDVCNAGFSSHGSK